MISRDNEAALQARGTPYILGARLKSRKADETRQILDLDGYVPWERGARSRSIGSYRTIEAGACRLVVTHSPRRARKDAHDRQRQIDRLRKKLARTGSAAEQSNRGTARFLDFPEGKVEINEAKIAAAARWDGLRGVVDLDDRDPCDLVIQYRQHAEIEACFRANKHDLRIRPVFHWKPRRVRAHVAICYMAYCCLQHLRFRLTAQGKPMSPDRIRRALNDLYYVILRETDGTGRFAIFNLA